MGFMDYIGDNAAQLDAVEYENELREKDPRVLQPDEQIVYAFAGRGGSGRDHYMLTNKRVIVRDKKGVHYLPSNVLHCLLRHRLKHIYLCRFSY